MTKDQLLENLANYGYPLLKPVDKPEEVLTALLDQDDARLLEGFPVVFLNMLKEQDKAKWEMDGWQAKGLSDRAKARLPYLLALSAHLFKLYKMEANYERRALNILTKLNKGTEVLSRVAEAFEKSESVNFDGFEFLPERFEKAFQTYVLQPSNDPAVEKKKHALEISLLSDEQGEMLKQYGVWQNKKFMGREFEGTLRMTVVINPDGDISRNLPMGRIVWGSQKRSRRQDHFPNDNGAKANGGRRATPPSWEQSRRSFLLILLF